MPRATFEPVKLTELKPRWFAEPGRTGQGVTFDCPCCRTQPPEKQVRLAVTFKNPLDGGSSFPLNKMRVLWEAINPNKDPGMPVTVPPGFLWERSGDSFEEMSFMPSVDASPAGHWHGFVRNGVAQ
jgi:hypothetical protein